VYEGNGDGREVDDREVGVVISEEGDQLIQYSVVVRKFGKPEQVRREVDLSLCRSLHLLGLRAVVYRDGMKLRFHPTKKEGGEVEVAHEGVEWGVE